MGKKWVTNSSILMVRFAAANPFPPNSFANVFSASQLASCAPFPTF